MLPWCAENGIHFLQDFTLLKLQEWRSTWKDNALSKSKKQERVRSFFRFCHNNGWSASNPAVSLSRIKVVQNPVQYFSNEDYRKIIGAVPIYGRHEVERTRLRTMTELLRWSALSTIDAVTLERNRLDSDDNLLVHRDKTGQPVFVPLPTYVAKLLRQVPSGPATYPRYFFWSGRGDPSSAVKDWQRAFRRLFLLADLKHQDGTRKRGSPKTFRTTWAVESLLAGVPLETVSKCLGHANTRVTEKHYLPFVQARQLQVIHHVKQSWKSMKPGPPVSERPRRAKSRSTARTMK